MKYLNIGCGNNFHPDWINLDLYKSKDVHYHNVKNKLPFIDNSADVIYHSHILEHLKKDEADKFIKDCFRVLRPGGIMRVVVPDLERIAKEYILNLGSGFSSMNKEVISKYNWNKIELFDQILRIRPGGEMINIIKSENFNKDYAIERNGDEIINVLKVLEGPSSFKSLIFKFIKKNNFIYNTLAVFVKKLNPQKSGEAHKWMYDRLDLKILLENNGFIDFSIMKYDGSNIENWSKYSLDKSSLGDFPRKPDSLFTEVRKPI